MAIRKNTSRASDRVKIKRMFAEGYSVQQIESRLSITPAHIQYILEGYEADAAQHKKAQQELNKFREAEKLAKGAESFKPAQVTENAEVLRKQMEARIRAEIAAEQAEKDVEEQPDEQTEATDETALEAAAEEATEAASRRRRRTA